jgi:hypothetical protein
MLPMRISRLTAAGALAAGVALGVAACGDAHKPSNAGTSNKSASVGVTKLTSDAYNHSACMRSHGVTNFPDPETFTQNGQSGVSIHVTPSITGSPAFQSAQKACAHLMPGGGAHQTNGPSPAEQRAHTEAILAFAACMRKHGFPRFPDPNSQGDLSLTAITSAGINLQAPAVKPAALACTSVSHGQITKADIERAIANPAASGHSESAASGPGG